MDGSGQFKKKLIILKLLLSVFSNYTILSEINVKIIQIFGMKWENVFSAVDWLKYRINFHINHFTVSSIAYFIQNQWRMNDSVNRWLDYFKLFWLLKTVLICPKFIKNIATAGLKYGHTLNKLWKVCLRFF